MPKDTGPRGQEEFTHHPILWPTLVGVGNGDPKGTMDRPRPHLWTLVRLPGPFLWTLGLAAQWADHPP